MHESNHAWWAYCAKKYPEYFTGSISVLELGSYNINGTVRDHFKVKDYVGVDWRSGPGVDIVSYAHTLNLGRKFHTVISASMLEHDPHWASSLKAMVDHLHPEGAIFLSWGSALCPVHCDEVAPDGGFHALKVGDVIACLQNIGIQVQEFFYEDNAPWNTSSQHPIGCTTLIGCHDDFSIRYQKILTPLDPSDEVRQIQIHERRIQDESIQRPERLTRAQITSKRQGRNSYRRRRN